MDGKWSSQRVVRTCRTVAVALVVLGSGWLPQATARAQQPEPAAVQSLAITLRAVGDTFVDSAKPTANYGGLTLLNIAATFSGPSTQGLVRFDLSAFPAGTVFSTARLRVEQTSASGSLWTMSAAGAASAWEENVVTWNTRPLPSTFAPESGFSPAGTGPGEKLADVLGWVNQWVNGSLPNNGFILSTRGATTPTVINLSSREGAKAPLLDLVYTLPPIRVCVNIEDPCTPAPGAIVSRTVGGGEVIAGAAGQLPADSMQVGERLWVRYKVASANGGALYYTTPTPVGVTATSFVNYGNGTEMRLVVRSSAPLWIQDLSASAQWHVQGNPAAASLMRERIIDASNYLYSFTDGQFALGTVTVHQRFEQWEDADLQLHANNSLQPKAFVGGVTPAETPDFSPTVPMSYTPGVVTMGSQWNRFGTPPGSLNLFEGEVYTDAEMVDDWSLALAHEFGHWLLYLFDTYTGVDGKASVELTLQCTGTAMGNVYAPTNHNFISSATHWQTNCAETSAFTNTGGRTEWETIAGWYPWVVIRRLPLVGPNAPPVQLTNVLFVPTAANAPAAELFDLDYQDDEVSSGEARAFLLRDNRVLEQGKPAEGSTQVHLTGPEVGDRLCVYDINDHAGQGATPRHQFGCEIIQTGDAVLEMTKNESWRPQVAIEQTGAATLQISVSQANLNPAVPLLGRIYPESDQALSEFVLVRSGDTWQATVNLPTSVPPVYLQLYAGETPGTPITRREVIADRGTGGGGAHGPAKLYTGVLVVSSDGNASYVDDDPVELKPGESMAWQSMPGTPLLPFDKWIYGQSYRLDAHPDSLVEGGEVQILFETGDLGMAGAAAEVQSVEGAGPHIYFWDGATWLELPTLLTPRPAGRVDGVSLAAAASMGEGVYAVLADAPPETAEFLPLVRR